MASSSSENLAVSQASSLLLWLGLLVFGGESSNGVELFDLWTGGLFEFDDILFLCKFILLFA